MRTAVFSTKGYDRRFLGAAAVGTPHEFKYFEPRLALETAPLANGFPAVCVFVNDQLGEPVLAVLAQGGTKLIALRCAGFNNVDLDAAANLGLKVARVPAYSPYAVAEHTVGLILALNRQFHRAYNRVRDGNFSLEGLLGFDLRGKTAGLVGTGQIGAVTAGILHGFGCRLLFYDVQENAACRALGSYLPLDVLFAEADIVSLHCPLVSATRHMIDAAALEKMKPGVMLINTSRGGLIDTQAVIDALKSKKIGYLGLDVYEEESDLFFEDLSGQVLQDDVFSRLLTFPNVLITGHQAFFTQTALEAISRVTIENLTAFESGLPLANEVTSQWVKK
jgi:D-lactate dehydrogenase